MLDTFSINHYITRMTQKAAFLDNDIHPSGEAYPVGLISHGVFCVINFNTGDNDMTQNADDFLDEDEDDWEDYETLSEILKRKLPVGWKFVKLNGITYRDMIEIREWINDNIKGQSVEINFGGECSYSVGVGFSNLNDAIFLKLRWGGE